MPANSKIIYPGIGIDVLVNDILHIYSSSAWGKYKIVDVIDNDNIFVMPIDANETISDVTFVESSNTFSGSVPIGKYVTIIDNGESYKVIAANTFDKQNKRSSIKSQFEVGSMIIDFPSDA
jgi:hypothetical protein